MLLLFTCALNPTANAPDLAANALDLAGQLGGVVVVARFWMVEWVPRIEK
uniref:Uncharacterized protein n=1 Tax=Fagus sylvatica TaxID=28930 RepID=A0A2N9G0T2_FAGSY